MDDVVDNDSKSTSENFPFSKTYMPIAAFHYILYHFLIIISCIALPDTDNINNIYSILQDINNYINQLDTDHCSARLYSGIIFAVFL